MLSESSLVPECQYVGTGRAEPIVVITMQVLLWVVC